MKRAFDPSEFGLTTIDVMPAGREMDALIAEQVMDDVVRRSGEGIERLGGYGIVARGEPVYPLIRPLPAYSTDIAAAWCIVERFDNRISLTGPYANYATGEYRRDDPGWIAEITILVPSGPGHWDGRKDIEAVADTAPLAICRAALKAVEQLLRNP